jgi:hypothetical protein
MHSGERLLFWQRRKEGRRGGFGGADWRAGVGLLDKDAELRAMWRVEYYRSER